MSQFSRVRHEQGHVDYINLDAVARIHAESVSEEEWVVKITFISGAEIVEGRYRSRDEARAAVMDALAP